MLYVEIFLYLVNVVGLTLKRDLIHFDYFPIHLVIAILRLLFPQDAFQLWLWGSSTIYLCGVGPWISGRGVSPNHHLLISWSEPDRQQDQHANTSKNVRICLTKDYWNIQRGCVLLLLTLLT